MTMSESLEELHGSAGVRRASGGMGGHVGAPMLEVGR